MLRTTWQKIVKWLMTSLVVTGLTLSLMSCGGSGAPTLPGLPKAPSRLSEVAPPATLLELRKVLDVHQPQVKILSPRSDETVQDTTVAVRLQVNDLPLFQDEDLGLGPHLHFILDNQPYEAIYDVSEPILLQDLTPGTHTIRVFASRPWHESFKNEGAYAQATFHIFAKTPDNNPNSAQPLLTYSRPKGEYGAEPVMLDFYLSNAPLHLVARESAEDNIVDWQIRATVNGESFTFDRWEPIYLKGLQPGRNWVQLELLDEQGYPFANAFNNTVRLIDYQPGGTDTLSQLIRGELSLVDAMPIVDPNYVPPAPEPEPEPEVEPELTPAPETEAIPKPALEPGDIPEVVPDESLNEPTFEPSEPASPALEPPPPAAPAAPLPPELNQALEELQEPKAENDRPSASPSGQFVPSKVSPAVSPYPIEVPQETKAKEQLTEEVEEELERLEQQESLLPGTNLEDATVAEDTPDLLIPMTLPETETAPIAPEPPIAPDNEEKLFDRAKHFLNRVLPRPTEPSPIPATPASPTVSPAPLEIPKIDSPADAVVIEEYE